MTVFKELVAEGFPPEAGRAIWRLQDARTRTLRTLAALTDVEVDMEPPGGGDTIGTLLYHMAAIELDWLFVDILQRDFPDDLAPWFHSSVRGDDDRLTPVRGEPVTLHMERLAVVRTVLVDELRALPAEEFERPRSVGEHEVTPMWVLHHLAQHEAEHRGQIGAVRALLAAGEQT